MIETGFLDLHTHILPGIDDGSKDWEMTKELLRLSYEQGVRKIVATPHNYPGKKPQDNGYILELVAQANEYAKQIDPEMEILSGNEIFFRDGIVRKIEHEHALTLNNSRYLLVEFHPTTPYSKIDKGIRELVSEGYIPIIAHVERVNELFSEGENIWEVIEAGAYIQTNTESLMGGMFNWQSSRIRKLISQGAIHFLASDCHNLNSRRPLMKDCVSKLYKKLPEEAVDKLVKGNVEKFLRGEFI